ncbi:MAG: DUF5926 family protein [Actinomycetaceae bacterium]|nr:DUF5926 family protein [Actinomycetaceae bacterium]
MGKKSRRKKLVPGKAPRPIIPHVARPFEGMSAEADLVAMREIIPAATLDATTTDEYGSTPFQFVTLLPGGAPAMVRDDGQILIALQTRSATRDAAHDLGVALSAALKRKKLIDEGEADAGTLTVDVRDAGPRIPDMIASAKPMELQENLGFWVSPGSRDEQVEQAIEDTSKELIPTRAVPGTTNTYWHDMGKHFVRWIRLEDEDQLFTALARLQAAGDLKLENAQFIGAFRALGLSIPVFEFPEPVEAEALTDSVLALEAKLEAALQNEEPLNDDEKRARAGLVSRQVSL